MALLTACDPSKDEISNPGAGITSEELGAGFTATQYSDDTYSTEQADGNYFKYSTNPVRVVEIYQLNDDGSKNILTKGASSGTFKLAPKRGGSPDQTYYIRTKGFDGTDVIAEKKVTVFVPTELEPAVRIIASDAYGHKVWKWDTSWRADGGAWGNMGYAPGDGESFVTGGNGIWWACPPADLTGQLQHSDTGVATGEEDPNAYMTFNWKKGIVTTYDAAGKEIRHGAWSISAWDMGNRSFASADGSQASWSLGTLHTDAGSILFPFQINAGGVKLGDFEIMQLDGDHLKLIYPYKSDGSVGSWNEATWWAFKKK